MRARLEKITPQKAKRLLRRGRLNRKVRKDLVVKIANAIRNGEWMVNGETIILGEDGVLIDGQHRLRAVLEADMPIESYVVVGSPPEAFATVDTGANRTGANVLEIEGYENGAWLSQALRWVYKFENEEVASKRFVRISNRQLLDLAAKHPELQRSVEFVAKTGHRKIFSPVGAGIFLHWLFSRRNKADADEFMRLLYTGDGLRRSGPEAFIYHVRERLVDLRDNTGRARFTLTQKLALTVKAWNHWRANDEHFVPQKLGWKYHTKKRVDREEFPVAV